MPTGRTATKHNSPKGAGARRGIAALARREADRTFARQNTLTGIARAHLRISSLVGVGSDREDFRDVHVDALLAALTAAYEAGRHSK